MAKVFAADEIKLNLANILDGTVDPSAGGGVARPLGSFYTRTAGSPGLYQKTGAAATAWEKLSQSLAWRSILDFGAIADGITDSTTAIQNAINEVAALGGGVVYVPRGTFVFSQLTISAMTGVQLVGAGPGAVLLWTFNAGTAAGSGLTITGNSTAIRVANLRFSGAGLTNPAASRDNHLLRLDGAGGGILDIHVEECWFGGMVAASGDGVHVVGSAGNLVNRVWLRDCVYDGCSRFGVGVEQGWHIGWILDSYFTNCETDIGFVSTANVLSDAIQIVNNEIIHTGAERRAVRIEGDATGLITHTMLSNNIILGGYVTLSNARFCSVYGNPIFSGTFASADPVLRVFGSFADSVIDANLIDRQGGNVGPCVTIEPVGAAVPTRFLFNNNMLIQEVASAPFLTVVDATRFTVGGNVCRATNAGASTVFGMDFQAVTVALDDAMIGTGNQISAVAGTFLAAVRLLANGANVLGVSIVTNQGNQIANGAQFEIGGGGGNFTTNQIMFAGNNWAATTLDFTGVGVTVIPRIGFNAGTFGSQLFTGAGSPEGVVTARTGSMYLNRSGGQGTSVWYKETGTGTAGWIAMGGVPLAFGTGDTTVAGATEIQIPVTRPGTLRNLRVQVTGAGTGAATVTYTVRVGGVDTTILATISNTATGAASDTTHTANVVAGNLISISIVKSGAVAAGQTNVIASLELV